MHARVLVQSIRPFSFTASVIPVLLGASLAWRLCPGSAAWHILPFALAAAVLIHAGTNAVNEYFDFKNGVDRKDTFGGSRVLVEGKAAAKDVLVFGLVLFLCGALAAAYIVASRGMPAAALLVCALAGGFFYTAKPVGYKYLGLGDFAVFVLMGPLMVAGAFYVLTGSFQPQVLHVSVPVGILVTSILSANNFRDIRDDRKAGIRTLENTIGFKASASLNAAWIVSSYASVLLMVIARILPVWALAVALTWGIARRNLKVIAAASEDRPESIVGLDMMNAQLHMAFGAILIIVVAFL